jgi:hypothetical protein
MGDRTMPENPIVVAAREVIVEIPERHAGYRSALVKALAQIVTLDDPSIATRRRATKDVIERLGDTLVNEGESLDAPE